nr:glycosyl hydrolase family 43 [Leptospira ryugenii]
MKTNIFWKLYQEDPLLKPRFPSPILADPSFLFPETTLDHKWHLVAHDIFGILHYHSENGIEWSKPKRLLFHGMRPFLFQERSTYYLYFEKYKPFHVLMSWFPFRKWESEIMVMTSKDLKHWDTPKTLLKPSKPFHSDSKWGNSVSNPCLVKVSDEKYRLYYSSSLAYVTDCGFCEPKHISVAESENPLGPFRIFSQPIFSPMESDMFCNVAAGSIKVLQWRDRFFGFQNGIYWNEEEKKSGSAILFLQSEDGLNWERINSIPILGPNGRGWKGSHIYACDVKFSEAEKLFILYFNARDKAHWTQGKEAIGLFVGKVEEIFKTNQTRPKAKAKPKAKKKMKGKRK